MKRVLALLLCLLLAFSLLILVACDEEDNGTNGSGNGNQNAHVHTYKTDAEWSKDASGHWYDVTCGCVDATVRKLQHVDDNKDAICDVCKFEYDHEHTYAEDWTADCTNHWKTADCGCIIAGAEVNAHVDANNDGECDTCKYVINDLHEHYYSQDWTGDLEYHWHAALCEHGVEVADKAAHEINAAGYCVVCDAKINEVDRTDISAILAAAVANNYKVMSGNVHYEEIVYDTPTELLNSKTDEVFFVLGKEDSYILLKNYNSNGTFIGGEQQYFETLENGEIFGIMMPIGSIDLATTQGNPNKLNGYNYTPGSILAAGYTDTSTLAQTIANFYDLMKTQADVKDIVESYDPETGKYSFSFEYLAVNATLQHPSDGSGGEGEMFYQAYVYFVDIAFTVNDDFVIDLCDFTVTSYRDWEMDQDITYDPETNTYEMLDTASATIYKYSVSQTSGERTFTTIYPKASFVPADFELFLVTGTDYDEDAHLYITDEVEIVDTDGDGIVDVVIDPYTFTRFHIGNVIPSSAIPSFMDDPVVTYENLNGSGTPWGSEANFQAPDFSGYMNAISFYTIDSGEYMFTITAGEVVKKVHVTITGEPAPDTSLDTPSDFHVKITEEGAYADEYKLVATEAGIYTFNLPAGLGLSSERGVFTAPGVQYTENEEGATLVFECWAGREITYYVTAGTRGWYNITVDYEAANIQKPLDPSETLTGVYDAAAGAETGTLTIDGTNKTIVFEHSKGSNSYTFTFDGGKFVLSNQYGPISSMMAPYHGILTLDENNLPATFTYDQKVYTLTLQGSEPTPDPGEDDEDELQGSGTESDPYVIPELGEYVANYKGGPNLVYYSYTATQSGIITITTSKFDGTSWMYLAMASNEGETDTLSAYIPAGATIIFQIGDWDEQAADVPFEVLFEEKTSEDFSDLVGTWYGDSGWGEIYTVVINADGTGTITQETGWGSSTYEITYIYVEGTSVAIGYSGNNREGAMECTYEDGVFACTNGLSMDSFVFQTTPIENGGGEDPEEPVEPESDPLKDAILGEYDDVIDGYVVFIYNSFGEDGYLVNVYQTNSNGEYVVDLYFQFDVQDNGDGSYKLTLTHLPVSYETGAENVDEILANDIVITPPEKTIEEILISTDFEGALNGESVMFYTDYETGLFMANFWGTGYDYYYLATVVDNLDGTYTITFVVDESNVTYNPDNDYFHADKTIIATYDGTSVSIAYEGEQEEPSTQGTFDNPFALVENNTCEFPGGYNFVWYSFTAPVAGNATISVTSDDYFWAYAFNADSVENVGKVQTASLSLTSGQTIYVGMSTNSGNAGTVEFTATFEPTTGGEEPEPPAQGSIDNPFALEASNSCEFPGGMDYVWYAYTADEAGSITITMTSSDFYWAYALDVNVVENVGSMASLAITLEAGQTIYVGVSTYSAAAGTVTFTYEFATGSEEETENETELALGNNAVEGSNVTYAYTATADIKLEIAVSGFVMNDVTVTYYVNDVEGSVIGANSSVEVELKAGDKLVIKAETTGGYTTITATEVVEQQGPSLEGSGTSADPYIITELPFEVSFSGNFDKYYKYVVAEDGVIVIHYVEGALVSDLPSDYVKDEQNLTYTINVKAGDVLKLNLWTMRSAGEFKYTIEKGEAVTPDPEEPGEGGEGEGTGSGDTTGINGTYYGSNGSRGMRVIIDTVADTLTITRAASGYVDNFEIGSPTTYNLVYSEVLAKATSGSTGSIAGTNISNIIFAADGTVESITWMGSNYTNYVKQ